MTILLILILLFILAPYLLKWSIKLWLRHISKKMQQGMDEHTDSGASSPSSSSTQHTSSSRHSPRNPQGRIFHKEEGTYVDFVEEKNTD